MSPVEYIGCSSACKNNNNNNITKKKNNPQQQQQNTKHKRNRSKSVVMTHLKKNLHYSEIHSDKGHISRLLLQLAHLRAAFNWKVTELKDLYAPLHQLQMHSHICRRLLLINAY